MLGRTGAEGLGPGWGPAAIAASARAQERPRPESVAVVRRALDLGVTFVDTARNCGTEELVGKGT